MIRVMTKRPNRAGKAELVTRCEQTASQHVRDIVNGFLLNGAHCERLSANNYAVDYRGETINIYTVEG